MRPVDLLGVEPIVPLPRLLGGQAVVLQVVPAHGDAQAAGGAKLHGLGRRALHAVLGLPPAAKVARLDQLLADLFQIPVPLGAGDAVQHTVEIFQLALALFQLERQHLLGGLGLGVALVILRRVLLGAFAGVERDVEGGAVRVIVVLGPEDRLSLFHAVEVGRDEVAPDAVLLPVGGVGQLLFLQGHLADQALPGLVEGF